MKTDRYTSGKIMFLISEAIERATLAGSEGNWIRARLNKV